MKPMSEAPSGMVLARAQPPSPMRGGFWSVVLGISERSEDRYAGFLPLPADASDAAIRECAVEWLNSLPESEREQAKKEIR